ncbi:hypothetical protein CUMW_174260 [Citrus unshiu]|uniref:Uncharacterized protein n=1 Tax=Citrus unshiu TaxID=55188 RepID=A0A2H5PWL6_CITUN|nr:hypothetical protein CUMW_174260 [Citrus unshiu]
MEDVAKAYDARFVINSSELGEDDPLKQNEQIRLPHGEALDIIGVNTGSLQGKIPTALPSASGDLLLNWLKSALEATNGHWCIVVGFHPLVICEEHEEQLEAKKI